MLKCRNTIKHDKLFVIDPAALYFSRKDKDLQSNETKSFQTIDTINLHRIVKGHISPASSTEAKLVPVWDERGCWERVFLIINILYLHTAGVKILVIIS